MSEEVGDMLQWRLTPWSTRVRNRGNKRTQGWERDAALVQGHHKLTDVLKLKHL